jgi:hypothetical protein
MSVEYLLPTEGADRDIDTEIAQEDAAIAALEFTPDVNAILSSQPVDDLIITDSSNSTGDESEEKEKRNSCRRHQEAVGHI